MIRDKLIPFSCGVLKSSQPKYIYLTRNSYIRKIVNELEIVDLLVKAGFVAVDVSSMSFIEQIALINSAEIIVSSTGASLANAIFCKSGASVAVLVGKHEEMIYNYWRNMLSNNVKLSYVLGSVVSGGVIGIHADYYIDPENVKKLLKSMGR